MRDGGSDGGPDERRPAVFLDRDGTVIVEADYLADPAGVHLVAGAAEAIRRLRRAGYAVVLTTNQSGIARGLYSLDDYRAVASRVQDLLQALEAGPDGTYFCPHHPDFTGPCGCRKPGPGMYVAARDELGLDLRRSFFVGDKISDVLAAAHFGGTGILVRTGHGAEEEAGAPPDVSVVDDVAAVAERILAVPRAAAPTLREASGGRTSEAEPVDPGKRPG
ncbi:MAG TPA: HAD family hydrolase [Longimicrobiales bacterium]|jgi:D-glycero-D-manno-heptose 1,7-bisphosphate phosphatase